jgi:hypothetical protein
MKNNKHDDGCLLGCSAVYQTTWRYNPENSHLHTCHHENLKSYLTNMISITGYVCHYRKTIGYVHSCFALMRDQGTVWHTGQQLKALPVVMDR